MFLEQANVQKIIHVSAKLVSVENDANLVCLDIFLQIIVFHLRIQHL